MPKEKILSSTKKTTSSPIKVAPAPAPAPKVDDSQKYKDAIADIVNANQKVATDPQNRNHRLGLRDAIAKAQALL
jgi:hypothetical protein